ncbi:MAG: sigma-70 family RNA polymerase sigma factor [Armatimonadetes bacterium]|nr:sigma-70 family RNA polymerase sigma factor [Armatimonadota bacterium]
MLRRLQKADRQEAAHRRQFERLARQYYDDVFRAAYRLTRDRDEAADLTQETLVKAYLGFSQFEPGTNFRAWLLRILANTHISRYRQTLRRPQTVEWEALTTTDGRETLAAADSAPGPEEAVMNLFTDEEIDRALAELPDEFRTVAIMADIYGMQYKDIAEALDIPIGTVRSRLFRARRLLRKSLASYARQRGMLGGF